jgi:hypothetical protein
MSVKLFDAKTFLCQFVNGLLGSHNLSINLSLNKEEIYTNAIVDSIIEKVINVSDIETNDCYFTFSNEEYDEMLQNAIEQRINGQSNYYLLETMIGEINTLKNINTDEKKQTITNVLNNVKNATQNGEGTKNSWKLNYDYQFELIRMLCYPLVKPLFSPKVMVLILINLYVMGNPLKLSNSLKNNNKNIVFDDIKPYIMGALTNIIVQIKDIINEILFSWVIEELTPLLSLFSLRLLMEQIEMYRLLLQDMLSACIGFKGNKNNVGIGNVEYVDIYPELEDMKKTVNSIINC